MLSSSVFRSHDTVKKPNYIVLPVADASTADPTKPRTMNHKFLFFLVAWCGLALILYFLYQLALTPTTYSLLKTESSNLSLTTVFSFLDDRESNNGRRQFFASKDVIVRSVYFDDRPRNNHKNASVFLVLVWKPITDDSLITGCQVGETRAENYQVKLIGETRMWRAYPTYNKIDHEEALVHCYDLPATNGSEAYLYYKLSVNSTEEKRVKAERPVMFPAARIKPKSEIGIKYNMTVLTCTKVYGKPPWLNEWISYQRAIGVDHVHLIADDSFFREMTKEIFYRIEELVLEGFLSIDFWISWLSNSKEVWYHNQGLILEDCLYQFRGTYDYVFILDTDDFFTPRVPSEPHVQYYIDNLCRSGKKCSCKFRWVEYYPDSFGLNASIPLISGNMTSQLMNYSHTMQGNRKSVHKTQAVIDVATHYAFDIMPGLERVEVPVSTAYVAHVRKGKKAPKEKLRIGLP